MKKPLSKKNQLKVLVEIKRRLKERLDKKSIELFLCSEVKWNMRKLFGSSEFIIPLFTRENAARICEENKLMLPNGVCVWWCTKEDEMHKTNPMNKIRYDFIICLIRELRNS